MEWPASSSTRLDSWATQIARRWRARRTRTSRSTALRFVPARPRTLPHLTAARALAHQCTYLARGQICESLFWVLDREMARGRLMALLLRDHFTEQNGRRPTAAEWLATATSDEQLQAVLGKIFVGNFAVDLREQGQQAREHALYAG